MRFAAALSVAVAVLAGATQATAQTPTERVIVSINASYLTASRTFDDTRTFDLYSETASFTSDYSARGRWVAPRTRCHVR